MRTLLTTFLLPILGLTVILSCQPKERKQQKEVKIIERQYEIVGDFHDGRALVTLNGRDGFIDRAGKLVIPLRYFGAYDFSEGLAAVGTDEQLGNVGFLDSLGNMIIKPQFQWAMAFTEGLAVARAGGKFGYIDKAGSFVINPSYNLMPGSFLQGLAPVTVEGRGGQSVNYVDVSGRSVIQTKFYAGSEFAEGLAAICSFDKSTFLMAWGYIDKRGRVVIQPRFESVGSFSEGVASFMKDGKWGFIAVSGKVLIRPQFDAVGDFHEGLARVEYGTPQILAYPGSTDTKCGFIDKSGKIVLNPIFDRAGDFSEGIVSVFSEGKWHFIDRSGATILAPVYRDTTSTDGSTSG